MMKDTRTATKRSSMDTDHLAGASNAVPNKRQALANISNDMNQAHGRNLKQKSAGADFSGKEKSHSAGLSPCHASAKALQKSGRLTVTNNAVLGNAAQMTPVVPACNNGTVQPAEASAEAVVQEPMSAEQESDGNAADIASLQRRTVNNLRISSAPTDAHGETCAGSPELKSRNWSCSMGYTCIDNNPADPQMCSVYATDIYAHLQAAEIRRRPATNFMETLQRDINSSMRAILIDWLVEVAEEYKLVPDTLYLTCSLIDRYLSKSEVPRSRLQLLGVSSMLIASKYEEIYPPQVDEFCYITDNTYKREEIIEMERRVLNELHFELSAPTIKSFLRRFIRAAQVSFEAPSLLLEFLGNYLAELTLVEYSFIKYLPSLIAASAVFVAKLTLNPDVYPWTPTLEHYTGYRPSALKECVEAMHALQRNLGGCTLPAIREKYSQAKFKSVSVLTSPEEINQRFFEDVITEPDVTVMKAWPA